jgi:urease accessory protein
MNTRLLLLADSRLPAGGHAHSGGLEPAVNARTLATVPDLADFLFGRLHTTGLVTAALAAAACRHATDLASPPSAARWDELDAEADARTPSPAQRQASRAQGKALLRAARATWPSAVLDELTARHHPIVLGVAAFAAGGTPEEAASIAAYGSVTGPASAAVRLLGLDPLLVHRALGDLAPQVDAVAVEACDFKDWADIPAASAPILDIFAELHLQSDLRLFES